MHRQLQVSTGTSSKWNPSLTGPYIVETINPDKTLDCKHLITNRIIKAHKTNLMHYKADRSSIQIPKNRNAKPIFD